MPNDTRAALFLALGETYLGLGIYQKAEPMLLKAYEGMNAGETEIPASSRKRLADAGADRRPLRRLGQDRQSGRMAKAAGGSHQDDRAKTMREQRTTRLA